MATQRRSNDAAAAPLDEEQVAALLRDISFHRRGRTLRRMLHRFAAGDAGVPLSRPRLAAALPASHRAQLGRYIAILNRLAASATRPMARPFCRTLRGGYVIHPKTRKGLRDILPAIERAGFREQPLWE